MNKKRIVIITGSASGIGLATAAVFLDRGWTVIGIDIKYDANSIRNIDEGFIRLRCDVTENNSRNFVFRQISKYISAYKEIDALCLFSCAGRAYREEFSSEYEVDENLWNRSINLNLSSHYMIFLLFKEEINKIKPRKSSILFMSSINACQSAGLPAYSAAKAGLIGLTKSLATPLGQDFGTTVNCLLSGTVDPKDVDRRENKDYEAPKHHSSLGRLAAEEDIGRVAYSILSEFDHMTGASVIVDGGQSVYFPSL